jgi:hypothetical protein
MNDQGDQNKPSPKSRETADDRKSAARKTTPIINPSETVAVNPDTKNPEWNDEERSYYRSYLFTQRALMFITFGGIGLALCTLYNLNESVKASNAQASAAATQADIFHNEEAAQVGVTDIRADHVGTVDAEIIITVHNSGQNSAKHFWFRKHDWAITKTMLDRLPFFPSTIFTAPQSSTVQMKAEMLAANKSWNDLERTFDPTLSIDDQHPVLPSEDSISRLADQEKQLGGPSKAQISKRVFIGEIGAASSWPLRIKVPAAFGAPIFKWNDKNQPSEEKQVSYFAFRCGYDDGLGDTRVSSDFCFKYVPEDNSFTFCQKPVD